MIKKIVNAIRNFMKKDPLVFTLVVMVVIIGGLFAQVEMLHFTSEPEFCAKCHPEEKTGPLSEFATWEKNIHATAGVKCLDCHGEPGFTGYFKAKMGGLRDLYGEFAHSKEHKLEILEKGATDPAYAAKLVPNSTCLFCHSDQINAETRRTKVMSIGVNFRKLDGVINPAFRESYEREDVLTGAVKTAVNPKHATHIDMGLNCVDCHLGVAHGGKFRNTPQMASCFKCHDQSRIDMGEIAAPKNEDCATCHVGQKAAQEGTLVKLDGEPIRWYMADLTCDSCHMSATDRPTPDACAGCHDASYGDMVKDMQSSFAEKAEALKTEWLKLAKERDHMVPGRARMVGKLGYYVRVLEKDGSKGIHNPDFFDAVIAAGEELVKKINEYKPGMEKELKKEVAAVAAPKAAPAPADNISTEADNDSK